MIIFLLNFLCAKGGTVVQLFWLLHEFPPSKDVAEAQIRCILGWTDGTSDQLYVNTNQSQDDSESEVFWGENAELTMRRSVT